MCEINKLKSELMSEQTSRKRSRVEFDKDFEFVQSEKEVIRTILVLLNSLNTY